MLRRPLAAGLALVLCPGAAAAQPLPESFEQCRRAEDPVSGIAACEDALGSPALLQAERARVLVMLAIYHRQAGQYPAALSALDKAAGIAPKASIIPTERAIVLHVSGDLAGAMKAHARAFALAPGSPAMFNNRGVTNLALGDTAAAIADFDSALSLLEGEGRVLANRAAAKCRAGDVDGSIADRLLALDSGELDPSRLQAEIERSGVDGAIGSEAGPGGALEKWTAAGCPGADAPEFL
jgi:tetratricopeptide (TPR) repeat protein